MGHVIALLFAFGINFFSMRRRLQVSPSDSFRTFWTVVGTATVLWIFIEAIVYNWFDSPGSSPVWMQIIGTLLAIVSLGANFWVLHYALKSAGTEAARKKAFRWAIGVNFVIFIHAAAVHFHLLSHLGA